MNGQQVPVSLLQSAAARPEHWSPGIVGRVNDHYVKTARILGEFPWHTHTLEDEMFLVLQGTLRIGRSAADGGPVDVQAGQFFIVPRGLRHNTSTPTGQECLIALIEPVATVHAGDTETPMSRSIAQQLG